jgi:3-dehydroquinate dehydratase / shikimate dehydrogenase
MQKPQLCVTVMARTLAELRERRDAVTGADLVELRLDSVEDPDVAGAIEGRRLPVLVTCRPAWEGGRFQGGEPERRAILAEAWDRGAEYVDIEFRAGFDDLIRARSGRRIVLSTHDFSGVPGDLHERVRAMRALGPEVVKVAVQARGLADCLSLKTIERDASQQPALVLVAMGAAGLATRVLAAHFGSCWTYAGDGGSVGQISAERMLGEFRFRSVSPGTAVYGIAGTPLGHSVSPAMHNAVFDALGLDAVYVPLAAASSEDFMTFARAMGVRGASVTIPFKAALFAQVDEADDLSVRAGAINTVRFDRERCLGRNTDVSGFLSALAGRFEARGARAAILGAGGAARAVAVGLAAAGAAVGVYARDIRKAEGVARIVGGRADLLPPRPGSWDLLVNATSVGMAPKETDTPFDGPFDGRVVYDLVYNPLRTKLLRDAAAAGCATIGGLDMLVAQAEEQSEWWTGRRPPTGVMRAAAARALGGPQEPERVR